MKGSHAIDGMHFLGYEPVPTDAPGTKSYKAKTTKRMLEVASLIIIARTTDKADASYLFSELSCLKNMIRYVVFEIYRQSYASYVESHAHVISESRLSSKCPGNSC